MYSPFALFFTALLVFAMGACGGTRNATPKKLPSVQAVPKNQTVEADRKARPPTMLWWQGEEPKCSAGEIEIRNLTWGSVYWCQLPSSKVDANLQNDLGRIAQCIHDSVSSFQQEPDPEHLEEFLKRANSSGLNPVACKVVRKDGDVRSYHGRKILMERTLLPKKTNTRAHSQSTVRYRFSCTECLVAAETSVKLWIQ